MKTIRFVAYCILAAASTFFLLPIAWIVFSSFRPIGQALTGYGVERITFIFTPTLEAYQRVIFGGEFLKQLLNSIIVSSSSVALSVLVGVPAAYVLSRVKTPLTRNIAIWIISTRMMPAFALALPFFIMMTTLHLVDTVFALILVYMTFNLSFVIWTLVGYFEEIPVELEKAARIDGCTQFQALRKVILPLSKPAVIAASVISYLLSWNEFLFAFILTSKEARTVTVHIANAVGLVILDWPAMTAMSTITMVPAFVFILLAQRYIIRGMTLRVW
jgi:multiple sugar transport system permease protein